MLNKFITFIIAVPVVYALKNSFKFMKDKHNMSYMTCCHRYIQHDTLSHIYTTWYIVKELYNMTCFHITMWQDPKRPQRLNIQFLFCHNIQNFGKNCNFKILTKMKISESIKYVISQLFFWEQWNSSGRRRNTAESFAKTLGKILEKFCEFKISLKPQH